MKKLRRMLFNKEGEISLTKAGGWAATLAGGILAVGLCPLALVPYCKLIIYIAGGTAIVGARDALK